MRFAWIGVALPFIVGSTDGLAGQSRIARPPSLRGVASVAPGGPSVSGIQLQSTRYTIGLRWHCSSTATGYEVIGAPMGGQPVVLTPTPIGPACVQDLAVPTDPRLGGAATYSAHYHHVGLQPGAQWSYVVRALYSTGGPADAPPTVGRTALWPAPAGIRADELGLGAYLQWNGVPGAAGFLVHRRLAGEKEFTQIAAVPVLYPLTYHDQSTVPAGVHEYAVQAVDGERSVASMVVGRPLVRVDVTQGAAAFGLRWSFASYRTAVGRIQTSTAATGPWVDVPGAGNIVGNAWGSNGKVGSTQYYKVIATHPTAVVESDVVTVTIKPTVGPTQLTFTYDKNRVTLIWVCDVEAMYYLVMKGFPGHGGRDFVSDAAGKPLQARQPGALVPGATCLWGEMIYPTSPMSYQYWIIPKYKDYGARGPEATVIVPVK